MPPSRFGQVSRYRNATLSTAKAHERFSELGLASLPDNGAGRLLAVTPVSGHVFARSGNGTNALLVLAPDAPQKYAKQPPTLHGVCQGTLADFDVSRFQDDEQHALLAAGSSSGSIAVRRVTLPGSAVKGGAPIETSDEKILPAAASGAGTATAVKFHPTSAPIVLSASNASSKVRVFDVGAEQTSSPVLEWDAEAPQWDVAWSTTGAQVAGAGKNLAVRIWDARQTKAVASFNAHASKVKPSKVTFISDTAEHLLLTTGFSQMRQREIAIWDQRKTTAPLKRITLDVASSSLDPVCEYDRGIVYLTAKGDSSIRWIDVGSQDQGGDFAEGAYPLDFSAASSALAPQLNADTSKGEIAKLLVATVPGGGGASSSDAIVPCSVQVPRRNYIDFHSDLYPHTAVRSGQGLSSTEWLAGSNASMQSVSLDPSAQRKPTASSSTLTQSHSQSQTVLTNEALIEKKQTSASNSNAVNEPPHKITPAQDSSAQANTKPVSNTAPVKKEVEGSSASSATRPVSSATTSTLCNGSSARQSTVSKTPVVNLHWSRKPMAGSTPLIPAHQNLGGLDISRGPDARMLAVSRRHLFVPLSGPGGRLGVHPIEVHGRLPLHMPCFIHGSPLVDFCVDPFNDDQVYTVAQDGVLRLWRVPSLVKDKDGNSSLPSLDNEKPVSSVTLSGTTKIASLVPHPFVGSLVAVLPSDASGSIVLADLASEKIAATLDAPGEGCFDAAWSPDGSVLAIAGRDKKVHVLDVRASQTKARALGHADAHDSPRSFSILWLDGEHLLSVGHTFGSMRQLKLYRIDEDTGELSSIAKENLDASPSILFPVWDADTNVLWLWSKGERIVSAYEVQPDDKDVFTILPAFQHGQPQLGLAFLPKDCVDVRNVELGKAVRLSKTELQHVAWNVPRSRPEFFQDDVYPPTVVARQPVLDTSAWLAGRDAYPIPRESLQPNGMTPLSQAPPPRAKQSSLSKGPTMRELTAKEREDQALQSVFEKAKGRDEGKDPNHNEDQAARAPDNDDWDDSD